MMALPLLDSQPLICDLTAIPGEAREQHLLTATQVFTAAQSVQELPNGYALRLPNEDGMFMALARFVENERRCCSFFRFELEVEPHGGPVWLRLTGGEGVKEMLQTLLSPHQNLATLKPLIHTGGDAQLDELVTQALPQFAGVLQVTQRS